MALVDCFFVVVGSSLVKGEGPEEEEERGEEFWEEVEGGDWVNWASVCFLMSFFLASAVWGCVYVCVLVV